ncbi:MAG: hypothetical protein ABMA13_23070 [Chthoniobacteraceae bacterium]
MIKLMVSDVVNIEVASLDDALTLIAAVRDQLLCVLYDDVEPVGAVAPKKSRAKVGGGAEKIARRRRRQTREEKERRGLQRRGARAGSEVQGEDRARLLLQGQQRQVSTRSVEGGAR